VVAAGAGEKEHSETAEDGFQNDGSDERHGSGLSDRRLR
jgi:hypothetical protein